MKNMIIRAVRTFIQAALGYAAANIVGLCGGEGLTNDALTGLLVASVAAGLSALMNLPHKEVLEEVIVEDISPAEERAKGNKEEEDG